MKGAGYSHMAIGHGSGKDKAKEAVDAVISSPLLETSIKGATRLLVNIVMSEDVLATDVGEFTELISGAADPSVNVIFGTSFDPEMKDEMNVTVIATGFADGTGVVVKADDKSAPELGSLSSGKLSDTDYSDLFSIFNK
jgi:cell division protein FtsZ